MKTLVVNRKYLVLILGRVDICGIICICQHLPYPIVNGQK